jgi:polyphosphate kinase
MTEIPLVNRDLSWLSFNARVLQEANDRDVPLMERMKFLAIYSSNLDEFFRIRVAGIKRLKKINRKTRAELSFNPAALLKDIHREVNLQQTEVSKIFIEQIVPELAANQIFLLRRLGLDANQKVEVEQYFRDFLLPYMMPVLLIRKRIRIFLANAQLYLAIHLKPKGKPNAESEYALIRIPSDALTRYVQLKSKAEKKYIILLDDVIRHNVALLFPGYEILDTYSIKLTRDQELYIEDEFVGNLVEKIKTSLTKRQVGPASRFVYDREMPASMLAFLAEMFDLKKSDLLPEGRYHNNYDFFKFPKFGLTHLLDMPFVPQPHPELKEGLSFFDLIAERDRMIHMPYQSIAPLLEFLRQAGTDPQVTHIKIVQYRVAKNSHVMSALMDAVKLGKQVTVFVEIKARFDEAANLEWGEKLTKAGVRVCYSFPGVKVHSKLLLVRRREATTIRNYCYLSTGNFHEGTAQTYCDLGIFTCDERITVDVSAIFAYLEYSRQPDDSFKHLLVGQFNLREGINALIDQEIENAKVQKPSGIIMKLNSLEDREMIRKLYDASCAGVRVQLIIRGICCLVPGIKGFSEHIQIVSVIDRYLEHSRVLVFQNGGDPKYFLTSADMMSRNLNMRIETMFPVFDQLLKDEIQLMLDIQLSDNVKSRVIDRYQQNAYRNTKDGSHLVRSQVELYFHYLRKAQEVVVP